MPRRFSRLGTIPAPFRLFACSSAPQSFLPHGGTIWMQLLRSLLRMAPAGGRFVCSGSPASTPLRAVVSFPATAPKTAAAGWQRRRWQQQGVEGRHAGWAGVRVGDQIRVIHRYVPAGGAIPLPPPSPRRLAACARYAGSPPLPARLQSAWRGFIGEPWSWRSPSSGACSECVGRGGRGRGQRQMTCLSAVTRISAPLPLLLPLCGASMQRPALPAPAAAPPPRPAGRRL